MQSDMEKAQVVVTFKSRGKTYEWTGYSAQVLLDYDDDYLDGPNCSAKRLNDTLIMTARFERVEGRYGKVTQID